MDHSLNSDLWLILADVSDEIEETKDKASAALALLSQDVDAVAEVRALLNEISPFQAKLLAAMSQLKAQKARAA